MRKTCYSVATSLDGFIAGPNGEAGWIVIDPEIGWCPAIVALERNRLENRKSGPHKRLEKRVCNDRRTPPDFEFGAIFARFDAC